MEWFATTPLGVEDVAAKELEEVTGSQVKVDVGKVFFRAPLIAMYIVNYSARTINRLYLLLAREKFNSLEDIYSIAKGIDYTNIITPDKWLPVLYLLVTRGVLETCTGFSLSHFICVGGSLGATLAGTTKPALRGVT